MKEFFYQERGIYYRTNTFESERPTLVFIHGLSSSSSAWYRFEKIFENQYNIITFDLRGHGKSHKPKKYSDYQIKYFAEDLFDLLQYLKVGKFILVSHSFGTLIALQFTALHQDKLQGEVFLSPSSKIHQTLSTKLTKYFLNLSRVLEIFPFNSKPRGHVEYSRFKNTGDWNIRRLFTDIRNTSFRVYFFSSRQAYSFDRADFLKDIHVPVLIVHGKKDSIFPVKNSIEMQKKITRSELIILNADHIIVLNNTEEVSTAIGEFVEKIRNL